MYDASIARCTGVDPIADQFAWVSPFNYAENEPIAHIDLHGLQSYHTSAAYHAETMRKAGMSNESVDKWLENNYSQQRMVAGTIGALLSPVDEGAAAAWVFSKIPGATRVMGAVSKFFDDIAGSADDIARSLDDITRPPEGKVPDTWFEINEASDFVGQGVQHVKGNLYRVTEGIWRNPSGKLTINRGFVNANSSRLDMESYWFTLVLTTSRGTVSNLSGVGMQPAVGSSFVTLRSLLQGSFLDNPTIWQKAAGAGTVTLGVSYGFYKYSQKFYKARKKEDNTKYSYPTIGPKY